MPNEYDIKGRLDSNGEYLFTDGLRERYEEKDMLPVENFLVSILKCKFLTIKNLLTKRRIPFTFVEGDGVCYLQEEKPRRIYKIGMNIFCDGTQVPEDELGVLSNLSDKQCVLEQSINRDIEVEVKYHLK